MAILLACMGKAYAAPEADITQNLRFGSFIPRNNDSVYSIVIETDGGMTSDSGLVPTGEPPLPQNGVIQLTGFTDGDEVTISFEPEDGLELVCDDCSGAPTFTVDDFVTDPASSITIDGSGEATVNFGASLYTSGSGIRYAGGNYAGTVTVNVVIDEI